MLDYCSTALLMPFESTGSDLGEHGGQQIACSQEMRKSRGPQHHRGLEGSCWGSAAVVLGPVASLQEAAGKGLRRPSTYPLMALLQRLRSKWATKRELLKRERRDPARSSIDISALQLTAGCLLQKSTQLTVYGLAEEKNQDARLLSARYGLRPHLLWQVAF